MSKTIKKPCKPCEKKPCKSREKTLQTLRKKTLQIPRKDPATPAKKLEDHESQIAGMGRDDSCCFEQSD